MGERVPSLGMMTTFQNHSARRKRNTIASHRGVQVAEGSSMKGLKSPKRRLRGSLTKMKYRMKWEYTLAKQRSSQEECMNWWRAPDRMRGKRLTRNCSKRMPTRRMPMKTSSLMPVISQKIKCLRKKKIWIQKCFKKRIPISRNYRKRRKKGFVRTAVWCLWCSW